MVILRNPALSGYFLSGQNKQEFEGNFLMDEVIDLLDAAAKLYPIKALAPEISKAESTLRNELCRQPGYKLGLVTAYLIMKKTADLKALDRIEELLGRVAFDLPEIIPADPKPVMLLVSQLSKEFSEAIQEVAFSMDPGSPGGPAILRNEVKKCLKEVTDLIKACVELKAYFQHVQQSNQSRRLKVYK